MRDDTQQSAAAEAALSSANSVYVGIHVLCEFCWVLARHYLVPKDEIAEAVRKIVQVRNASVDQAAVNAGLHMLDAGGDFADGVIAHQGRLGGGDTFVSFDKKAIKLMHNQGYTAHLLSVDRPQTGN